MVNLSNYGLMAYGLNGVMLSVKEKESITSVNQSGTVLTVKKVNTNFEGK